MQRTSRVAEARCDPMFFLQTTALTLSSFFDKVSAKLGSDASQRGEVNTVIGHIIW